MSSLPRLLPVRRPDRTAVGLHGLLAGQQVWPHAATLASFRVKTAVAVFSTTEQHKLNDGKSVQPNSSDLDLLANLLDRAQMLPLGPERAAALLEIRSFQQRLAAIWRQAAAN